MTVEAQNYSVDESIINKSRNDLIYSAQGPAIAILSLAVLGFAISLHGHVSTVALLVWTTCCIGSYLMRLVLYAQYQKSPSEQKSSVIWQVRFSIASCISGIIWGAASFTIFPDDSPSLQLVLILLIVFLASATTVTHSAYKWGSLSFSTCSLLPTALKLFLIPQAGQNELAGIVIGFWLVMGFSSIYLANIANRMFELTNANAKLVSDLTHKNVELEQYNHRLEETKGELSKANDSLQKLLTTDALTGLTNRRRFDALSTIKWGRCAAEKHPIALIILNIDGFKHYNDYYGHRKGDNCLMRIGTYLSQLSKIHRQGDCVARYSGDEFAILLSDSDATYAHAVAEELRKGIEMLRIVCSDVPNGISPWVSVSAGVASQTEFDNSSVDVLLDHADKAMSSAKHAGKNQVKVYQGQSRDDGLVPVGLRFT